MMQLTTKEIQNWLTDFDDVIQRQKDDLSELDTAIGDGDHGNNMARGMMAYQEAMEKARPDTISDTFKALAMALIAKVGGASGPLYGSAFLELAKATKTIASIDSLPQLGELLEQGVLGIQGRGKAQLDDKTMVDVWLPVIAALKAGYLEETVISSAKEHTAELVAKKGRASYLGERAVGHIDPGAASSALLFETLLPYLK